MPERPSLWSRTKPLSLKALPMSVYGWRQDRSSVALPTCTKKWRQDEHRRRSYASDFGERPSPGVALERRHQLHAVFLFAGGGDLQLLVRPDRGRVATYRRWSDMGGISLCRRGGFESDLGPRNAQPGAGCIPCFPSSTERSVSRKGHGKFHLRYRAAGVDDAA